MYLTMCILLLFVRERKWNSFSWSRWNMSRMRSFGIGTVSYYISVFIVQRISANLCPGVTQKIEIASTERTARSFNLGYYHFNISSTDSKS